MPAYSKPTFDDVLDEIHNARYEDRRVVMRYPNFFLPVQGQSGPAKQGIEKVYQAEGYAAVISVAQQLDGEIDAIAAGIANGVGDRKHLGKLRRDFALRWHPDRFTVPQDREMATQAMQRVNEMIENACRTGQAGSHSDAV